MAVVWDDTMEDADETNLSAHTPSGGGGAWTVALTGTSVAKIDTAQKFSGTSSVRFEPKGAATNSVTADHTFTEQPTEVNSYVKWRRDDYVTGQMDQLMMHCTDKSKLGPIMSIGYAPNKIYYYHLTSAYDSGLTTAPDIWYELKYVVNNATKTYSAYIRGGAFADWTAICENKSFYHAATWGTKVIGNLELFSYENVASPYAVWWDDVQIGDADPAGWSGKYLGVSNPAKVIGTSKPYVKKVDGVLSA